MPVASIACERPDRHPNARRDLADVAVGDRNVHALVETLIRIDYGSTRHHKVVQAPTSIEKIGRMILTHTEAMRVPLLGIAGGRESLLL